MLCNRTDTFFEHWSSMDRDELFFWSEWLLFSEDCKAKIDNGQCAMISDKQYVNGGRVQEPELSPQDHYKFGYQECLAETMHFLVELEGFFPSDTLCVKLIGHLQKYYEKIAKGESNKCVMKSSRVFIFPPATFAVLLHCCFDVVGVAYFYFEGVEFFHPL